MAIERRGEGNQLPERVNEVLNETQLLTLRRMERFGWTLAFIRRPLFQDAVPVLSHPDTDLLGRLEDDGTLNTQSDIEFRK